MLIPLSCAQSCFGYRPEREGWGSLSQVLPLHPKFPLELSCGQLEDHTAPGQELPAAGGSGDRLRRCSQLEMSRYKTGSLQDYSGLEKEPSVVWHFWCAAKLQISLPSQECGCTALGKVGQKCLNKEEREESKGRKWKCSMSARKRCVGIDFSITQYREES